MNFETIWFPFIIFEAVYKVKFEKNSTFQKSIYSWFRGAFGKALRSISCVLKSVASCAECKLNLSCPYGYLFETVRPSKTDRLRKYPYLPHPFSLYIPFTPLSSDLNSQKVLKVGVMLAGKGIYFFPHVVLALMLISRKKYFKDKPVLEFFQLVNPLTNQVIDTSGEIEIPEVVKWQNIGFEAISDWGSIKDLKIKILSPMELRFEGSVVFPERFNFSVLIRNLLRRISTLAYFHCGKEIKLDFKRIVELSEMVQTQAELRVVKIKRKSQRTGQVHPLYGLIGEAEFKGEVLSEFYPLLVLGSFVQAGKHTSFGFGKYQIFQYSI